MKADRNATRALAVLQSYRPRLVLMDVQMLGMSGLELAKQLKADLAANGILIIADAAFAMNGDELQTPQARSGAP
jgi:CheY-like chemotaxis protein